MEKLQAQVVLEILGRPANHVEEAIKGLVDKMDSEKGFNVLEKVFHEPTKVEESKDLYTTFAEVTVELDTLDNYFGLVFAYMPSHIDLIYPEKITLANYDLNQLANKLVQRLHEYDAIVKNTTYEKDILMSKLKEVAPQLFGNPEQKTKKKETQKQSLPKKKKKKSTG